MRSENVGWFRELGADSGKTPNSPETTDIFTTNSRREGAARTLSSSSINGHLSNYFKSSELIGFDLIVRELSDANCFHWHRW
jgi:hypothetical protein